MAHMPAQVRRDARDIVGLDAELAQVPIDGELDALIARRQAVAEAATAFETEFGHGLTFWLQYPWRS